MKRGFTLVELSIVLVVIGLLIGGILVAQSMIQTAKTVSFISQMAQYNVALKNFYVKYNSLPGDSALFGGDGDKMIESTEYPCTPNQHCAASYMSGEIAAFWQNLSSSGLQSRDSTSYSNNYSTGIKFSGSLVNAPKAILGNNAAVIGGRNFYWSTGSRAEDGFSILDCSAMTNNTYTCKATFKKEEVLAVDNKIDDGVPNTGNIFGAKFGHGFGTGILIFDGTGITSTPFITLQDYSALPFNTINMVMGIRFYDVGD